jgi:predicted nuclease of predicted toxin-antitoxin system
VKVLVDSCVWAGAREALEQAGYDVVSVSDWPEDPGDDDILRVAHEQARILITRDKDFGALAVRDARPHCGILRLVRIPASKLGPIAAAVIAGHGKELEAGAIITADETRVRVRLPNA